MQVKVKGQGSRLGSGMKAQTTPEEMTAPLTAPIVAAVLVLVAVRTAVLTELGTSTVYSVTAAENVGWIELDPAGGVGWIELDPAGGQHGCEGVRR